MKRIVMGAVVTACLSVLAAPDEMRRTEGGRASVPSGASQVFVGGGQPGFAQCLEAKVAW